MQYTKPHLHARLFRYAICFVIGAGFAVSVAHYFLGISLLDHQSIVILLSLAVLFGLSANEFVFWTALPRLSSFSKKAKAAWMFASVLAGAFLTLVIPLPISGLATTHRLEIIATGQRNPLSTGSEVWVINVRHPNGSVVPISEFDLIGVWEERSGMLVSYQDQPASLKWEGRIDGSLTVTLLSHSVSGIAVVRWDDTEQIIDLYNPTQSKREIVLAGSSSSWELEHKVGAAVVYVANIISLGTLVFLLGVFFVTRSVNHTHSWPNSKGVWLYYTLPCAVIWSLYLLAFWPGIMSPDSIVQWEQAVSGHFSDIHPAFHTMMIWLCTRIWMTPAMVALVQIIALSAVAGWGFALIGRLGVARWLVWGACIAFAFSPVNGAWVVTLWKDIPYSIAVLALTLFVLQVVVSNGLWLQHRGAWALMGGVAGLVALLRHNGPVAAFGTPLVLALVYRKRRRALYALVLTVGLWLTVKGPVYKLVGVETLGGETGRRYQMELPLNQVAAHVSAGTPMTSEERSYLDSILPLKNGWPYYCYDYILNFYNTPPEFNWTRITENPGKFLRVYAALTLRRPFVNLQHFGCASSIIWRITQPAEGYIYNTPVLANERKEPSYIPDNSFGLVPDPVLPELWWTLVAINQASQEGPWHYRMTIWRPAIYLYLLLAGVIIAAIRARNWKVLLVAVPVLLHSALMILLIPGQDSRFQYAVYLTCLVLWPGLYFSDLSRGNGTSEKGNL